MKKPILFYIALTMALTLVFIAIFAKHLAPYNPEFVELSAKLQPPGPDHWLGTDHMGRDVFSRLVTGTRLSLSIAGIVTLINLCIGVPLGLVVGWAGGGLEKTFTWLTNIVLAFPSFLLSMAFAGILGQGLGNIIIAVSSVGWVPYARVIRNMVVLMKDQEYVLGAKTMGAPVPYILRVHVLPFVFKPILIMALMSIGEVVLMISGFSFLGIGVQPNVSEWGMMLNDAKSYIRSIPGLAIYPGMAILITVVTFNLLGEYLKKQERVDLWRD